MKNENNTQENKGIEVQLHLELSPRCSERIQDDVFRDLVQTLSNKSYQGVSAILEVCHNGRKMKMEFSCEEEHLPYADLDMRY